MSNLFKDRCRGTEFKFMWFPKRCCLTNKVLWLEKAYKQTVVWTGPDVLVFEHRYYDKNEFLIAKIKGVV